MAASRSVSEDGPPPPAGDEYEPQPDACAVCGGRGWHTPGVPVGHPEFGQVVTCQCQRQRLEEERTSRLLRYGNLDHLSRFTFESVDPRGRTDDPRDHLLFEHAHAAAVEYAEEPKGWLVLTGPNGAGKTHLAAAIAERCIASGRVAFFVHVPDLLDHLRASFSPGSEVSYSELFDQVRSTPLLVLDGLGAQSVTSWAQEKLQQIFNHRFNALLPTVVTTASELDEIDPYIGSRLKSSGVSRVVEVGRKASELAHRLGGIEPEMLRRMTFDTFDARGNNPSASQRRSLEGAYLFAKNYAADPDGWLTLFGDTGVGKTHLAVAIAGARLREGDQVFFAFVPDLLDYLRNTFSPDSRVSYDSLFDEVKNARLLVLDDLGQELSSPWAEEKLYQIIVHRHNARLPTVITSMTDFTRERESGSIASRIRDVTVGQLSLIEAPDYRIKDKPL